MRILLVEDDPAQADTLAKLLTKASEKDGKSLSIFKAGTLREGLAKSNSLYVDVTYLDLCLPDTKDWMEVIHAIPEFYPPVIVVTGLDDADHKIELECYTYRAQNFFQKTRDMKLLVPHLLSTGASAHLRREAPKRLENDGPPQ